jgi:hypothetical protein
MKILIIFRGENERPSHNHSNRKYINALMCWNNWKESIVENLQLNGDICDIAFITYKSELITKIIEVIQPKFIEICEKINQYDNYQHIVKFMKYHKEEYDRFVILRCDIEYKIRITKWPKWNETGIFIVNRDVHWYNHKLYADIIFIIDTESVDIFTKVVNNCEKHSPMHVIGKYLYENNIPFHLMYEEYYHMLEHPLHSLASLQEHPDLDNPIPGIQIEDVSIFNH